MTPQQEQDVPVWILAGYSHRFFNSSFGADTRAELRRRVQRHGMRYDARFTVDNLEAVPPWESPPAPNR